MHTKGAGGVYRVYDMRRKLSSYRREMRIYREARAREKSGERGGLKGKTAMVHR